MTKATILITDDAMFMRSMLKGILITSKCAVLEAGNGQEAIDQYKAHRPDLVFMDITMPGMDGIAATKAIRAIDPQATIVMCSAMGQQTMVVEAVRAGARDFIVKPFSPDRVLECINKFCLGKAA
jgi:two-component system chemotaxis response regulator CheY